ncbi:MAG: isocitrate lyase/PEP mutase family protein [Pseudomonadota bacterium]
MADKRLRQAIEAGETILAPGVYDMLSALMADRLGFTALYVTGFGVSASHLGLPDAGFATYTDMVSRVSQIVAGTNTPVVADADTGFGGLLNVRHTVRGYEAAGVSAIQIEDQEFPKKCGHTLGRRVIPINDMVAKIGVAVEARQSEDFLIIARTDSRTSMGLDEALKRAAAYDAAGADLIFVESPETEEELAAVSAAMKKPLVANMVQGGRTPVLPADRLKELGYSLVLHPGLGFLSAAHALSSAYKELAAEGHISTTPLHNFKELCSILGFDDVYAFDQRWAEPTSREAAE